MVNAEQPPAASRIRCRQIVDDDLAALVDLLKRGFGSRRTRAFWQRALAHLRARAVPADMPRYGYVLENDGTPVGLILLISAATPGTGEPRANVSSWYVNPAFRSYAPLIVSQALKLKHVTYLNISPAPHTWPILAAQGYQRYSNGVFVAAAWVRRSAPSVRVLAADCAPDAPFAPFERDLMIEHAAAGCIGVWCATGERAFPFVFRPRLIRGVIPCALLVYCGDVADVVRFAGTLGRHLAARGLPFMIIDANGPIDGLTGRYFDNTQPKFFRGPTRPRLGDLAYTEAALFGM